MQPLLGELDHGSVQHNFTPLLRGTAVDLRPRYFVHVSDCILTNYEDQVARCDLGRRSLGATAPKVELVSCLQWGSIPLQTALWVGLGEHYYRVSDRTLARRV
jgi:hypothetical protein